MESQSLSKPSISFIFPVYKDEKTIRVVAEKAIQFCEEYASDYEVIIINDCSPDDCGRLGDQLSIEYPKLRIIHHETNLGYGAAIKTGMFAAKFEFICQTDGDDEYDVEDFKKIIKLKDFYDIIITFRYRKIYSNKRIFISYVYNRILRWMFRTNFRDISSGMRMIRRDILEDIKLLTNSPFIGAELTIKSMLKGYRIGEMGIQTFPREFGRGSSTSLKNITLTIKDLFGVYREIFSDNYDLPQGRSRDKRKNM